MTVKQTYCDYDTSRGFHSNTGLGCFKGKVVRKVIFGTDSSEENTFYLCSACDRSLRKIAIDQGWKIRSEEV